MNLSLFSFVLHHFVGKGKYVCQEAKSLEAEEQLLTLVQWKSHQKLRPVPELGQPKADKVRQGGRGKDWDLRANPKTSISDTLLACQTS